MTTLAQKTMTVVTNPTGGTITYSFLPKHGMTLTAGESVSIPGDLVQTLAALPRQRKFDALKAAIVANKITLTSRPILNG